MVLFIQKLKEILDACPKCKDKYELVPISGNQSNKIADVLVGIHDAPSIELDGPAWTVKSAYYFKAKGQTWPDTDEKKYLFFKPKLVTFGRTKFRVLPNSLFFCLHNKAYFLFLITCKTSRGVSTVCLGFQQFCKVGNMVVRAPDVKFVLPGTARRHARG